MTQRIQSAALLALVAFNIDCRAIVSVGSSSFLSNFSLADLVKRNRSPSGMGCAREGLGGIGGGGGGTSVGSYGLGQSSSKSSSFSCQINAVENFDEASFIASLKADVEKEIKGAGAEVVSQGNSAPVGFFFEYRQGGIQGRVTVSGEKRGTYYTLEASLNESSGG